MSTALLASLAGGAASAIFYLSVVFGGVGALILGYLAPLPLFVVGLWLGMPATLVAGGLGAVLVLSATGGVMASFGYLVSGVVPAAFVVRQALLARTKADGGIEWYPPGLLLTGLTGLAFTGFVIAMLLTMGEPGGLEGVVREALSQMARLLAPPGQPAPAPEDIWIAPAMPGLVATSWMVMTIVNGALAQGLLMRFGRNRRPPMRLSETELPSWMPIAFAVAVAVAMTPTGMLGFVALNASLILAIPFAFVGLAVVHAFARRQKARVALLVGFYLFLFLFGWPVVVMVGLGVIEQWMGLRSRLAARGPDQEDE